MFAILGGVCRMSHSNPTQKSIGQGMGASLPPGMTEREIGRPQIDWADIRSRQATWFRSGWRRRRAVVQRFRHHVAHKAREIAEATPEIRERPANEIVLAQVLPLLEACRFLERFGGRILGSQEVGPLRMAAGLSGIAAEVHREPYGVVLIIAPSNYSLYLSAVTVVQALAAGNAVILKPGRQNAASGRVLADTWAEAGLPSGMLTVLSDSDMAAREALGMPFDKLLFTGQTETGRLVAQELAPRLIPAQYELSGCDFCYIRRDADLFLAARAIRFGLHLNGGRTCIAPRRILVHRAVAERFRPFLQTTLAEEPVSTIDLEQRPVFRQRLEQALLCGAKWLSGGGWKGSWLTLPAVLDHVTSKMEILEEAWFFPLLALTEVESDEEVTGLVNASAYRLGASVFSSDTRCAEKLAELFNVGTVTINDVIVPTAHPQVPFEGRGQSGFGVAQGAEGLLALTRPKTILRRKRGHHFHLPPRCPPKTESLLDYLVLRHGCGINRRINVLARFFLRLVCSFRPVGSRRNKKNP